MCFQVTKFHVARAVYLSVCPCRLWLVMWGCVGGGGVNADTPSPAETGPYITTLTWPSHSSSFNPKPIFNSPYSTVAKNIQIHAWSLIGENTGMGRVNRTDVFRRDQNAQVGFRREFCGFIHTICLIKSFWEKWSLLWYSFTSLLKLYHKRQTAVFFLFPVSFKALQIVSVIYICGITA